MRILYIIQVRKGTCTVLCSPTVLCTRAIIKVHPSQMKHKIKSNKCGLYKKYEVVLTHL